jgi:hypothetical protein
MTWTTVRGAVSIGAAGEHLAMSAFKALEYQCALANLEGTDIILFDDDNTPLRVEVKTATGPRKDTGKAWAFMTSKGSKTKRQITTDDADLICYVALDLRRICVRCTSTVTGKRTSLYRDDFLEPEQKQIRLAISKARRRLDDN